MKYVLITAARNEEKLIEGTLRSVVSQTSLPERWVIMDDGSTDRTAEIVERMRRDTRGSIWCDAEAGGPELRGKGARGQCGVGADAIGEIRRGGQPRRRRVV